MDFTFKNPIYIHASLKSVSLQRIVLIEKNVNLIKQKTPGQQTMSHHCLHSLETQVSSL